MKKTTLKLIMFIACIHVYMHSYGYDFSGKDSDGLVWYFTKTGSNTVEVTTDGKSNWKGQYYGDVYIPSGFTNSGVSYTVTSVGHKVFNECPDMTSVSFPNSITQINPDAFIKCSGLKSVTLPKSLKSFSLNVFNSCTNIKSINIDSSNQYFKSENGVLYTKNGSELVAYAPGNTGSFSVPNTVKTIAPYAFYCSKLSSVTLPNTISTIEGLVFEFSDLSSITIPPSIKTIYEDAFYGCLNLSQVYITDLAAWCRINFANTFNALRGTLLYVNGALVSDLSIPDGVTSISKYAFQGMWFNSVTLPSSLSSLGDYTFASCMMLADVYSYAQIPPKCTSKTFDGSAPQHSKLHVPKGCSRSYALSTGWQDFGSIVDDLSSGIEDVTIDENCDGCIEVYNLHGVRMNVSEIDELSTLPHGVYIVNGKKVII